VAIPGNLGGMNWSSGAFDPQRQLFVTNVNNLAMEVHLIPRDQYLPQEQAAEAGKFRGDVSPQHGTPYGMSRQAILSPQGLPCLPPPWGELVAVDMSRGTIRWHVPLGAAVKISGKTIPVAGTPNLGGPIVTAGGLVFIGSSMDDSFLRFRGGHRGSSMDGSATSGWPGDAHDIPGKRKAIRGHFGGRARKVRHDSW